jgi:N-acetylmuramoyl-L-alanine amidase
MLPQTFCFWAFLTFLCFPGFVCAVPGIVVIDPGHGGHDRGGGPGQRIGEKNLTLDTALRLQRVLRAYGIRTILTRSDDRFISLDQRTGIANAYGSPRGIFVSIHYNSGQREGAFGIETYYYSGRSYSLAAQIHPRVIRAMDSVDRGIRRRGFWVLRRNRLPAVLVECGFLTNRAEAAKALNPLYRQRTAEAIARGILAR